MTLRSLLAAIGLAMATVPAWSQDTNPEVKALVEKAIADFNDKKYDQALAALVEADAKAPNDVFILNLAGAIHAKKKEYAEAKTYFDRAIDVNPSFFPARFNQGEIYFLQAQYPQALDHFTRMLNADPKNELLQFKVVLCLLLSNQDEEARALARRMKFPGEGPAWYFSQAAVELKSKNKKKAMAYIASAESIFPGKTSLYRETFEDLSWPLK